MLALLTALSLAAGVAAAPVTVPDTASDSAAVRAPADSVAPALALAVPAGRALPMHELAAPSDTTRPRRPRAVEYSDWYARRLTVHRIASYTMLPLFAAEWVLGDQLIRQQEGAAQGTDYVRGSTRNLHSATAGAIAGLFTLNTVTGLWNLYESRHDPAGRGLRTTHTVLMLASDAGFAATGLLAGNASENEREDGSTGGTSSGARTHRNAALASMGVGVVGTAIMWFGHD